MLASLYDFVPEQFGLPPFEDWICGELVPVEPPWTLKGTVVKGFGRGSKELGIPTANLDSASLQVSSLTLTCVRNEENATLREVITYPLPVHASIC